MPSLLRMPEVAANATDAVLQEWAVTEGSAFGARDALATVETEKAVVDIEADTAGVVLKQLVPADSRVEVGAPIALLGSPGESVDDVEAALASLGVVAPAPAAAPVRRTVPADPEGGTADTGAAGVPEVTVPAPQDGAAAEDPGSGVNGRIFASPLARRLAKEAGLELTDLDGTGPRNRITRRDVEGAVALRSTQPRPAPDGDWTEQPHSSMRRAIAARLTQSKQTTPHFYVRGTARVDKLVALRRELNEGGPAVSLNDLVVKAVARTHELVPRVNVTWAGDAIRHHTSVDVAVAVATDDGLLTPVVRGVEKVSVSALSGQVRDLAERARAKRLRQEDLEGGTITVTNLGMYGTEEFAAIINPPQSAILAVGAAREEPVVRKGRLRVGTVMRVTLSVDHRAVDGVHAAEWMKVFLDLLEHPVRILA